MKRALGAMLVLTLALSAMAVSGRAFAQQSPSDAFGEACAGNPGFFSFAVENPGESTEAYAAFCACLVTEFAAYPEPDVEMLTKDVEGSATPEDRTAYGDYTALELKARGAADRCVAAAGLGAERADMTGFDAACQSSELLLGSIGGTPEEAAPVRATLCQCLSSELAPRVTTVDADVLGRDLDGTATDASREAHPGYAALTETAGAAFQQCAAAAAAPAAP